MDITKVGTIVTSGMDGLHTGTCVEFKVGSFGNSKEDAIQRVQTSVLINSIVLLDLERGGTIECQHRRLLPHARTVVDNKDKLGPIFNYKET